MNGPLISDGNWNLGVFALSEKLIEDWPDKVAEIFAMIRAVPVRIEVRPDLGVYEYTALSEVFRPIPHYSQCPHYVLNIEEKGGKVFNVEAVEVI